MALTEKMESDASGCAKAARRENAEFRYIIMQKPN
jgi:hypothetical protein